MQTVGPYRLLGVLGTCAVGGVWSAVDGSGRQFTIAILDAAAAGNPGWRDAFAATAHALSQAEDDGLPLVNADYAGPTPWAACAAEESIGAAQIFVALGLEYQPSAVVPPAPPTPVEDLAHPTDLPAPDETPVAGDPVAPVPAADTAAEPPSPATSDAPVLPGSGSATPVNPWQAGPPQPVNPWATGPGQPVSVPPQPVSVPPLPVSGAPQPAPVSPHAAPFSPHPVSSSPHPVSGSPQSFPPGPMPPVGPTSYEAYPPLRHIVASEPPRRRTGLWIGIAALVVVVLAGGGSAVAIATLRGGEGPTPVPATSAPAMGLPTGPPVSPGVEPPRPGAWPTNWPRYKDTDSVRTLPNLDGLGFTLKVPLDWQCTLAGRAEGFVKYNCGAYAGTDKEIGGELIVRDCPQPCDEAAQATMRAVEEAWGAQWIRSGQYAYYAEKILENDGGQERHGVVVVAFWRGGGDGRIDREVVFRMTSPIHDSQQLRRIVVYLRDTLVF